MTPLKAEKSRHKRSDAGAPTQRKRPQHGEHGAVAATGKTQVTRAAKTKPESGRQGPGVASVRRATFPCFQCGTQVPYDSDRCPKCRSFYIKDIKSEDVDELLRAEEMDETTLEDLVDRICPPGIHFDAETGAVQLIDGGRGAAAFSPECGHCGTIVELSTDRCPMCSSQMGQMDAGLVSMFDGMDFDPGPLDDADCPFCGEHVTLVSGRCPACDKDMGRCDKHDPLSKVRPVLKLDNVVYLRLDISTGEVSFLQRNFAGRGYEHACLRLDQASDEGSRRGRSESSRS